MASFTQLPSGNWRVQVRRKNRYVSETFRRRKDGEDWALDMERNIDRSGSASDGNDQKMPLLNLMGFDAWSYCSNRLSSRKG